MVLGSKRSSLSNPLTFISIAKKIREEKRRKGGRGRMGKSRTGGPGCSEYKMAVLLLE